MRLLVVSPEIEDAISWWRAWGPFCAMDGLELTSHSVQREGPPPWSKIERCDAMFINRPNNPVYGPLIGKAILSGIPTWLDLDDHYWDVPNYSPSFSVFQSPGMRGAIYESIVNSREISVSTPVIRDYILENLAPDASITVVPNALPDWYTWNKFERKKTILFRGSPYRVGDLYNVADDLPRIEAEFPEWEFIFCGEQPWMVPFKKPPMWQPHKDLPEFHAWLRTSCVSIVVQPLTDIPFNRAKSNIAWLEASFAGAVCLAPDFEEFQHEGCVRYGPGEFYEKLRWLIADADRAELVRQSRETIDAKFRLSTVNKLRSTLAQTCNARRFVDAS